MYAVHNPVNILQKGHLAALIQPLPDCRHSQQKKHNLKFMSPEGPDAFSKYST